MKTLNIYFVRHAQSERNRYPELICGRSNGLNLSVEGHEQCALLNKRFTEGDLKDLCFDEIFCSSAYRAETTLHRSYTKECPVEICDDLLEVSQGDWEGEDRNAIYTKEVIQKVNADPMGFKAPNGESLKEATIRMKNLFAYILVKYSEETVESFNVGVFGHGLSFKCLIMDILGIDPLKLRDIVIENSSVSHLSFSYETKRWTLHYLGDYSHLRN